MSKKPTQKRRRKRRRPARQRKQQQQQIQPDFDWRLPFPPLGPEDRLSSLVDYREITPDYDKFVAEMGGGGVVVPKVGEAVEV